MSIPFFVISGYGSCCSESESLIISFLTKSGFGVSCPYAIVSENKLRINVEMTLNEMYTTKKTMPYMVSIAPSPPV